MTSLRPLLLTLGPEGSMPLAIPGAEARLLDPLPGQASPRIASASELENGYKTLSTFLQTLPDAQPVILYGQGAYGTLAVHALGKTNRFSAAVIHSALVDPLSALGLTDTVLPDPGKSLESQVHALALDCVLEEIRSVSCPLLILHGEKDERVPSAQSDELFVLMKSLHPELPTRLLLFPEEGHVFSKGAQSVLLHAVHDFLNVCLGGEG